MTTPRLQMAALAGGLAALGGCLIGAMFDATEFFRAYLLAFLFCLSFATGSLGLKLLHNVAGGKWGVVIGRFLDASTRTLPLVAVLAVPLLAGIPQLYEWSHREVVAADEVLKHKEAYLNPPFFIARTCLYFAIWIGLSILLRRRTQTDFRRGLAVSAPGLIVFAFTISFAAIDWIMSLEPHWFSTIYGPIFLVGQTLQMLAFAIVLLAYFEDREPFAGIIDAQHFHDLGNLLLAFTVLWAYTSFSQFLIIWSGNIPEETPWYLRRTEGIWIFVSIALMAFHFAVPLAVLLSRKVKRKGRALAGIAALVLFMRFVDLVYWVEPSFRREHFSYLWMHLLAPVGLLGIWLAAFLWQLGHRPLLDTEDPRLAMEVAH